jgi:hypothetical protein
MHRTVHTPFVFLLVIYELGPENQAVTLLELCDDAAGCCISRIIVYQPALIIRVSLRNIILWRKTEFSVGNYEHGPIMRSCLLH